MDATQLLGAVGVLLGTLSLGVVLHELSHALALRALGVDCDIEWLPGSGASGILRASALGTWASVTPRSLPGTVPAWGLRASALMPLALLLPFALIPLGVAPDPASTDNPYLIAASVAWLASALPSPQDFSVVWYAHRLLDGDDVFE